MVMAKQLSDVMKDKNKADSIDELIKNCNQASKQISESDPFICLGVKER